MIRSLSLAALLLVAACGQQKTAPPAQSNEVANATAPAVAPDVPLLEGDWNVTRIEGRDAPSASLGASFHGGQATLSAGCLKRAWTYTQKRNVVSFVSAPGRSSNCGSAPNGTQETAYAALNEANIAIFSGGGKIADLSGTGGNLTLERR